MWNLVINKTTNEVIQLIQVDNTTNIMTNDLSYIYSTKFEALAQISTLGSIYNGSELTYDISKLVIRRRLRAINLETTFDAVLAASPQILADWNDAQCINTGDPMLLIAIPILMQVSGITEDVINTILMPDEG